jgi:hypothetical protein
MAKWDTGGIQGYLRHALTRCTQSSTQAFYGYSRLNIMEKLQSLKSNLLIPSQIKVVVSTQQVVYKVDSLRSIRYGTKTRYIVDS